MSRSTLVAFLEVGQQIESCRHVVVAPVVEFGVDALAGEKIESPAQAQGGGFAMLVDCAAEALGEAVVQRQDAAVLDDDALENTFEIFRSRCRMAVAEAVALLAEHLPERGAKEAGSGFAFERSRPFIKREFETPIACFNS